MLYYIEQEWKLTIQRSQGKSSTRTWDSPMRQQTVSQYSFKKWCIISEILLCAGMMSSKNGVGYCQIPSGNLTVRY